MSARLKQAISWIATILAFAVGALALAASIVALALFVFVIHHLISQFGIANWSSLGVAALFVAIVGGIWLIGNSCWTSSLRAVLAVTQQSGVGAPGSGDWIALLFVRRVVLFPRLIGAVADPPSEAIAKSPRGGVSPLVVRKTR